MGVNNRQRRAAKQRQRQRRRHHQRERHTGHTSEETGPSAYDEVLLLVSSAMYRLTGRRLEDAEALAAAEALLRIVRPQPRELVETVLADQLTRLGARARGGGWPAADLAELVTRMAGEHHLALLRSVIDESSTIRLDTIDRLASGLAVAAVLHRAPVLDASTMPADRATSKAATEHPKLAQVRALLAKAESTEFDEEAEALTAKAQELISRYALERLVEQQDTGAQAVDDMGVRRIWLDAPYVRAKCTLVHEVADANRCRSAGADWLGFCLVVGAPADLDAVELLVTSLLVQADTAMLRAGRRVDRVGQSRTRSFRRSFLIAYATRVGERLREANSQAMTADGRSDDLLPVLRDHETRVSDAFESMVPHTVGKATTISNGEGWAAGVAAADLARLDVHGKLTEQTG